MQRLVGFVPVPTISIPQLAHYTLPQVPGLSRLRRRIARYCTTVALSTACAGSRVVPKIHSGGHWDGTRCWFMVRL